MNRLTGTVGVLVLIGLTVLTSGGAVAECDINGVSEATWAGDDPGAPADWMYTLTITWNTDSPYGVSHVDLVPGAGGRCTCEDMEEAFFWIDPVGSSDGVPEPCEVLYMMLLECDGDPSIDLDEPVLKFEYYEDTGCEPGPTGMMVVSFYSPFAPADIEVPNLALVDKHAQLTCWGELTGVFPGMPCDPVSGGHATWGALKSIFGD